MNGSLDPGFRTRFAPSPTGWLHLGHVVNAIHVWGLARAHGGTVVLRLEDHDRARCRPEYEAGILADLAWLGLEPDERAEPLRQSEAEGRYAAALAQLEARGLVYACDCSRKSIAEASPVAPGEEPRYPGHCRARGVDPASTPARRIVVAPGEERFTDLRLGAQAQDPSRQCGDLLARDRLGQWSYQFAVTVDDIAHGIDVIVRGEDLLSSTGRQLRLARMLGRERMPRTWHHPLIYKPGGEKLSKSAGDSGVRELQAAGVAPEVVLGRAAFLGGVVERERAVRVEELGALFRA
jgi:glutamyl-tRNA synthetase/glutamyl-Q tRNA(Asp) synthetase